MSEWKNKAFKVIFEADTPTGKFFDVLLLVAILLSVLAVMAESVETLNIKYRKILYIAEWSFTILFTAEYILRIVITQKPRSYIFSFYGIIDLLSILPTYLSIVFVGSQSLLIIRAIRLLRVFRIFKLGRFIGEGRNLILALKAARPKIIVFMVGVLTLVIILGTIMYLVEGEEAGFTSIPASIYWAIVTLTTVGYGDITPDTIFGQMIASIAMITGYAIIAVPTGILTVELSKTRSHSINTTVCDNCGFDDHADNASYCMKCGNKLNDEVTT